MNGGSSADNSGAHQPRPTDQGRRQPVFNLPSIIVWMLALMWLIQLARDHLLTDAQDFRLVVEGGFIPLRYLMGGAGQGNALLWSPVTYSFLHDGFTHLILNSVFLMAFGSVVARRIGTGRFLVLWICSAVGSAAAYWVLNRYSGVPVIGASGVISAMMGAAARFAFPTSGRFDRLHGHLLPLQSLRQAMMNRTVIVYTAAWFGINALTAIGVNTAGGMEGQVAWEAHLGGFLFGFLLFPLFDVRRGAWP